MNGIIQAGLGFGRVIGGQDHSAAIASTARVTRAQPVRLANRGRSEAARGIRVTVRDPAWTPPTKLNSTRNGHTTVKLAFWSVSELLPT